MFIRSERLFLRPGWPEDWEELLGLIDDEAVVRNLAQAPWPYSGENARHFLSEGRDAGLPHFLITQPGTYGTRLIGCIGLSPVEGDVNLDYWIAPPHWGQGFASEAVRAVLSLARALGHRRIVSSHAVDNLASGRVLEKAGFRKTDRIVERFSQGRGVPYAAREYALGSDSPCDCDNRRAKSALADDSAMCMRAA